MSAVQRTGALAGNRLPHFVCESTRGAIGSRELSGRPVLLLFLPSFNDEASRAYLRDYISDEDEYRRLDAAVVVVTAGSVSVAEDLPFPVVPDGSELFSQFHLVHDEGPWAGVVIADRYGYVVQWDSEPSADLLPSQSRVAQVLQGAESVCPECGVPEQRWLDAVG